jgi:hypothetical protein
MLVPEGPDSANTESAFAGQKTSESLLLPQVVRLPPQTVSQIVRWKILRKYRSTMILTGTRP